MKFTKPNKAQTILLLVGLGGIAAVIVYEKFFSSSTSAAVATPASGGAQASFVGTKGAFNDYYSADGNNSNKCNELVKALNAVRSALSNSQSLAPSQITNFRGQEMAILSELQKYNCPNGSI